MSFTIGIVTTAASQHLRGGLAKSKTPVVELVELDAGQAVVDASPLAEAHALVFTLGSSAELAVVEEVAGALHTLHDRHVPRLIVGADARYTPAGVPEAQFETLAPKFWAAVDQVLDVFATHASPRVVVIDDDVNNLDGTPCPGVTIDRSWNWLVPLPYEVAFEHRNGAHERDVRRLVRGLCSTPIGAPATRVLLDIQLGSDWEGAALATELLFADAKTEIFPISVHAKQRNFDRAAALLAHAFTDRLYGASAKRGKASWEAYLPAVLRGTRATPRDVPFEQDHVKIKPESTDKALRAALLTLLSPEFPYRLAARDPRHLGFVQQRDTSVPPAAARDASELGSALAEDRTVARFLKSWMPVDLQPAASSASAGLTLLLPDLRIIKTLGGPTPLRDVMTEALRGVTGGAWSGSLDGLNPWIDELFAVYVRDGISGPLSHVITKHKAKHREAVSLLDVLAGTKAPDTVRLRLGELGAPCSVVGAQFMGVASSSPSDKAGLLLLGCAALEYMRAWTASNKQDTQGGQSSERFDTLMRKLPMHPDSLWGRRGWGTRQPMSGQRYDELVNDCDIGHRPGSPWDGPEVLEILVQLTLPLLGVPKTEKAP